MFTTNDSRPLRTRLTDWYTIVQDSDPASVATLHEINLFLLMRTDLWSIYMFLALKRVFDNVLLAPGKNRLKTLINTLASQYELIEEDNMNAPVTYYYRTSYAVYFWPCSDKCNRPVVLSDTEAVLKFIRDWHVRFREALAEADREEYDRLYTSLLSAFDTWAHIARPLSLPPFPALHAWQETGRLTHQRQNSTPSRTCAPISLTGMRRFLEI